MCKTKEKTYYARIVLHNGSYHFQKGILKAGGKVKAEVVEEEDEEEEEDEGG